MSPNIRSRQLKKVNYHQYQNSIIAIPAGPNNIGKSQFPQFRFKGHNQAIHEPHLNDEAQHLCATTGNVNRTLR